MSHEEDNDVNYNASGNEEKNDDINKIEVYDEDHYDYLIGQALKP